jgi:hypothetical protein
MVPVWVAGSRKATDVYLLKELGGIRYMAPDT